MGSGEFGEFKEASAVNFMGSGEFGAFKGASGGNFTGSGRLSRLCSGRL